MGCHFLLQGIFPAQGSSLGLLHRQVVSVLLSRRSISSAVLLAIFPFSKNMMTRSVDWFIQYIFTVFVALYWGMRLARQTVVLALVELII